MKKLLSVIAVILTAALVFSGCGEKKKLIMATESGFAPYEYLDGDKIVGVDVDIATQIATELGRTLEVVDMPFDSVILSVMTGKADIGAAGISIRPDREEQVDFSIEYVVTTQVILTREDSDIKTPEDIAGKVIGVQLGTASDFEISDTHEEKQIQRYQKYFEASADLASGRIDAIVLDALPAQEVLKTQTGLVILPEPLFTDTYAICVKKDNKELLDGVNKVLQRLLDEGKIAEYTMNHMN